ncbi:hypothetical protein K440DRAFT_678886 [Wilcoxina mikolae CBS 423.85]|nr:hypothetical protein K440DRAFT_678886 [Wilcoxina mikolae CBS 423.85]
MLENLRIHKTYNVSEFKRCMIDESRPPATPPPIRVTERGDVVQGMQAIRKWKIDDNGKVLLRVEWEGQPEDEEWTWELLTNLTRFGGKETVREYAITINDESLNKLLPNNLRPAFPSAPWEPATTTRPWAAKIKGLPLTRRSARIAAIQE